MAGALQAGAAFAEITPKDSQFLYGYPHVERYSTGIHDALFSSAVYLSDGRTPVIFIGNDIIFVGKDTAARVRERICAQTGVPAGNIMVTATHTHSGPNTVAYISNQSDPVIPPVDSNYVGFMEEQMVSAAVAAVGKSGAAEVGLSIADGRGIGTNRRDPNGPADPEVPVLVVRGAEDKANIACMLVCSMHPTVLHEDSRLVSADFPGMSRRYLQERVLGEQCVVVHNTGPAGNQSPRHVTKANTFDEAERLGQVLGVAVEKAVSEVEYHAHVKLDCRRQFVDLPRKTFPPLQEAEEALDRAVRRLEELKRTGARAQEVRTAECDWFGAEETVTLSRAADQGKLERAYESSLPAEIQVIKVGPWNFVGWQGEIFIEYALEVKRRCKDTFVISLANGELQGYIVTPEAAAEGGYEASNALFAADSGRILVEETVKTVEGIQATG